MIPIIITEVSKTIIRSDMNAIITKTVNTINETPYAQQKYKWQISATNSKMNCAIKLGKPTPRFAYPPVLLLSWLRRGLTTEKSYIYIYIYIYIYREKKEDASAIG